MAARLKSILGRIHWSLPLRVIIFGFGWLVLPFWLFVILALYLYLVPFFDVRRFFLPFLAVIFFAAIEPKSFLFAVVFSGTFYLILGAKDLIFIDRKTAYEILTLLLSFFIFIGFFSRFDSWAGGAPFLYTFISGALIFFLVRGFLNYSGESNLFAAERQRLGSVVAIIVGLAVLEIMIAALFLPVNYLYQSAVAFLAAALAVELSSDYLAGRLTRRALLLNLSIFLTFMVIILGSAQWGL
jgi:hypothetical protein